MERPSGAGADGLGSFRLFYSYASEDEVLQEKLEKHLALLQRQGILETWHSIQAGIPWEQELQHRLEDADLILLLVSADYLASERCHDMHMQRALVRQRAGLTRIVPVLLRDCDWSDAPFAGLQPLPLNGRPVTSWQNEDAAWADIARGVRVVLSGPGPRPAPAPAVPTRIGRYRIERRIGRGGMGAVYEAIHPDIGGRFAIKILHPHCADSPGAAARLFQEARATNRVDHPGIVRIFDCGQLSDGAPYIVMELVAGETLAAHLARHGGRLPGGLTIARKIASVLATVHEGGIIHRDLKPDNVMLVADPDLPGGHRVKVLDFGIAKLAEEYRESVTGRAMTQPGAVLGTPLYMAPEQGQDAGLVTERADVYALGVMLYEFLSGRIPLSAGSAMSILVQRATRDAPPLDEVEPGLGREVVRLVARMLARDPRDRPAMREVCERLAASDRAGGAGPVRSSPPRSSRWTLVAALALGATGSAGLLFALKERKASVGTSNAASNAAAARDLAAPVDAAQAVEPLLWNVRSTPPGAGVTEILGEGREGRPLGETPLIVRPADGGDSVRIRLYQKGYYRREVTLDANSGKRPHFELVPILPGK